VTTRLKATLLREPESSSRATARRGTEKLFDENSDANYARPPTDAVLTALFWVIPSYRAPVVFQSEDEMEELAIDGMVEPIVALVAGHA
jgi:hypothetical protein